MDEFLTIPRLKSAVEKKGLVISEVTVRRYIENYPEFFEWEKFGKYKRYNVEKAIPVIKRIHQISEPGKGRDEFLKILKEEFPVIEAPAPDFEEEPGSMPSGIFEFGPETLGVFKDIRSFLQQIAEKTA